MQLNNKGYTLIELLATMLVLGILMAVTIPNITGISTQNKVTAYAEDAKKFKNIVEYKLRGDNTVKKPTSNGQCVIVALNLVHGSEFDNPPYGGTYMKDKSFVVMVKKNKRFHYYVQLVEGIDCNEDLTSCSSYRGYGLIDSLDLEGTKYFDEVDESDDLSSPFVNADLSVDKVSVDITESLDKTKYETKKSLAEIKNMLPSGIGCSDLLAVYNSV